MKDIRKDIYEQQRAEDTHELKAMHDRSRAHGVDIAADRQRAVRRTSLKNIALGGLAIGVTTAILYAATEQGAETAGSPVHDPANIPHLNHDHTPPTP